MNYKDNYEQWLSKLAKDDPLRVELASINEDPEIEDRFYQYLSFGTAGLRGKLGAGTNRMNRLTVGRAARGIADFILSKGNEAMEKGVVIAHDPRHFSEDFCRLSACTFADSGIKVFIFDGMRPTPQLAYTIRRLGAVCGINVTASHNPKEYNGYKIYWEDGCQVSSEIADGMSLFIEKTDLWSAAEGSDPATDGSCFDDLLSTGMITILDPSYDREYLDKIESLAIYKSGISGGSGSGSDADLDLSIPIVYTPLNGCGAVPFTQMLRDRGFTNWMMVPEQTDPDPDFTTVGYPNPEDPAAFALCEKYGRETGAELLMATDPDADRFAIEVLGPEGDYIPLNGNQTGYLLVNYILEGLKETGRLPEKGAMVKSIVTSNLSEIICRAYGVTMFETLTGFKNICGKIPWLEENGFTYLFGYEESIGYAPSKDIRDKDGISAGMLVAEAAAYYKGKGLTLFQVLQDIYARYGYFAEGAHSIVLEGIPGLERIGRMMEHLRGIVPDSICGIRVENVIDYIDGHEDIPPQNAMRIFLENGSWMAIRPSGTEPKIKSYYYSAASSREEAISINDSIRDEMISLLDSVE